MTASSIDLTEALVQYQVPATVTVAARGLVKYMAEAYTRYLEAEAALERVRATNHSAIVLLAAEQELQEATARVNGAGTMLYALDESQASPILLAARRVAGWTKSWG